MFECVCVCFGLSMYFSLCMGRNVYLVVSLCANMFVCISVCVSACMWGWVWVCCVCLCFSCLVRPSRYSCLCFFNESLASAWQQWISKYGCSLFFPANQNNALALFLPNLFVSKSKTYYFLSQAICADFCSSFNIVIHFLSVWIVL